MLDTLVTLNIATRQGYVTLPDPARGGANVRHDVGRLLRLGVDADLATIDDVDPRPCIARLLLGHSTVDVTDLCGDRDEGFVRDVAEGIG